MPPKRKFTKEEIVTSALELVSERGLEFMSMLMLIKSGRLKQSTPVPKMEG